MPVRARHGILLLLGLAPSWAPAAAQDDFTPLLKAQTVKIAVAREGGGTEVGSGILLCQDESQAYILTARHVLFGKSPGNIREPDAGEVNRIEISLFRNLAPAIVESRQEKVITKQSAGKSRDLLLLTVPLQQVLPATAVLSTAPVGSEVDSRSGERQAAVYAVGSQQEAGKVATSWTLVEGTLFRRDPDLLYHTAPITPGFSGGPLFNESGALIGINVDIASGLEVGGDQGVQYGRALAIGPVIETVNKWLPGN